MEDWHPRFSLLDSEVEGWLLDKIVGGNGLQDTSRDPQLSAAVIMPGQCPRRAYLADNHHAVQGSPGSNPTLVPLLHCTRNASSDMLLFAAIFRRGPVAAKAALFQQTTNAQGATGAIPLLPACRTQ